jgi:predicted deacylase
MHHFEMIDLECYSPGTARQLAVHRFGEAGAAPKVYIEAGIHADELPANLVACHLVKRLMAAAEDGTITGEIIVVPQANPIGVSNVSGNVLMGRYHIQSGQNYNRHWPDVSAAALAACDGKWRGEKDQDTKVLRDGIASALDAVTPGNEAEALRLRLMKLAFDADIVLDLHTDSEAELHLYADPDHAETAQQLAGLIGAPIIMYARTSGNGPFEETCALPYVRAREGGHDVALPFTTVIELRGERDVSDDLADADAAAIVRFLTAHGVISGDAGALPGFDGIAANFAATQLVTAPAAGIIVFKREVGAMVEAGDVLAEIVNPLVAHDTAPVAVRAETDGRFFARTSERIAWPGSMLGKVHGHNPLAGREEGALLYD